MKYKGKTIALGVMSRMQPAYARMAATMVQREIVKMYEEGCTKEEIVIALGGSPLGVEGGHRMWQAVNYVTGRCDQVEKTEGGAT